MTSAVGQYATLALAKERILQPGTTDTSNDSLIQSLCDQVNEWVEQKTNRILVPIPYWSGTFSGTAGDRFITVDDALGLAVGDDLLLGPLSGTHEAWEVLQLDPPAASPAAAWQAGHAYILGDVVQPTTPNTHTYICVHAGTSHATTEPTWPTDGSSVADNTVIWSDQGTPSQVVYLQAALVNSYAPGTVCQRIYIQDGFDATEGGTSFVFPRGIITLAALEVSTYTGGPFSTIPNTDRFLRPSGPDLQPGWPYTSCVMTNIPSAANQQPLFYPGYDNVRFIGPGPCVGLADGYGFGWPAMPDDIRDVALKMVVAAFRERTSSGGETFTVNLDGSRVYERALSWEDKQKIERYRIKTAMVT